MNWPKQIVVVRHAQSEGNVLATEDLSWDIPANHAFALTAKGKHQATLTGAYLRKEYGEFDAYFVSTFRRTQETLKCMYPEAQPAIDSRINEMWRGIWHAMPHTELRNLYPAEEQIQKREGWYHYQPLGGHSCQDVELRVHSFCAYLREVYCDKKVLVCTHGNLGILFWRVVLNCLPAEAEHRYLHNGYKNASVTVYEKNCIGELELLLDNFTPWE